MEAENDVLQGAYTAEFWMYDSRLLRRWEPDPITYDWQSPYACFNNDPINFVDPLGLKAEGSSGGETVMQKFDSKGNAIGAKPPTGIDDVIVIGKKPSVFTKLWRGVKSVTKATGEIAKVAVASISGFLNAFGSNHLAGVGRIDPSQHWGGDKSMQRASEIGQKVGDAYSIVAGAVEFVGGVAGDGVSVVLDATGIGAVAGVPLMALSTAVAAEGLLTMQTASRNLFSAKKNSESLHNTPPESSGSPGSGKLLKKDLDSVKKGEIKSHDTYKGNEHPEWAGAEEFKTPNSPSQSGWRIIKQKRSDGTVRYGWTKDHYKHIQEFK
jgi:RHS repeat-associated protein